jgi:hypothetical protein
VTVPQTPTRPTFLPLTLQLTLPPTETAAARSAAENLRRRAAEADVAAADCWTALLANCDSPGRRTLADRLHALTDAAAAYAGEDWWYGDGAHHRRRVARAQLELVEAARAGDGAEFAEAFVGYDQAVATTVVAVQKGQKKLGSHA